MLIFTIFNNSALTILFPRFADGSNDADAAALLILKLSFLYGILLMALRIFENTLDDAANIIGKYKAKYIPLKFSKFLKTFRQN